MQADNGYAFGLGRHKSEHIGDCLFVDVTRDKHHARAPVFAWPNLEKHWWVPDMLDAVNDNRSVKLHKIDNAFDAQNIHPAKRNQKIEPAIENL